MGRVFLQMPALAMMALCAMGCASSGPGPANAGSAVAQEEWEAQLRASIAVELARAREAQGPRGEEIVYARPYYYREYFEFPGQEGEFSLEFTEKESRTTPLTAELEVEKIRYATRPKDDRDEARGDEDVLRSRGIDYVSYELRNGEWRRVGELFLVDSTEEKLDGEWKQVKEERRPTALVEAESKSWFERLKFWK